MENPAWCSICKHGPAPPSDEAVLETAYFSARHDSYCPGCDLPILRGQQIGRWSDHKYRHEGCGP